MAYEVSIRLESVGKIYGRKSSATRALHDVSLSIADGEQVALLGLNGAGKSTLIKMLCGVLAPSSGRLLVTGLDPWRHRRRVSNQIGVMFGQRTQLWWDLPVSDSFALLAEIYGIPAPVRDKRLASADADLELAALLPVPLRKLSLGQRVRCDLAAAMLHDPAILLLDEPTIGMDIPTKDRVRAALLERRARGDRTLLLTTHDMADIQALCERIILLDRGTLAFDGSMSAFLATLAYRAQVRVTFAQARPSGLDTARPATLLSTQDADHTHVYGVPAEADLPSVVAGVLAAGSVTSLTTSVATIDDVIRQRYQHGGS